MCRVALCLATKCDNKYLKEYIAHHLSIGINKFILIDNNEPDAENPLDVLQEYLDYIIYIDKRGNHSLSRQWDFYTEVYNQYNEQFDWICFWDSDEYLFLNIHKTIQDWLSMECFKDVDVVAPNWKMYSDNNLLEYDDRPVIDRFTEPCPLDVRAGYNFPHDNHIKSIIRCHGRKDIVFKHPHFAISVSGIPLKTANASGHIIRSNWPFCEYNFKHAELRHYQTKSTQEFCERRLSNVRNADLRRFDGTKINIQDEVHYYFMLNEYTDEKMNYIRKFLGIL